MKLTQRPSPRRDSRRSALPKNHWPEPMADGMAPHRLGSADKPQQYGRSAWVVLWLGTLVGGLAVGTLVQAQVVADPNAPRHLQPQVIAAPNGVPVVNIQTPTPGGVSHNQYQQFNVGRPGLILNNARHAVQSQTGGWVPGNPWLTGQAASVILNEVTSHHPSLLQGYLEVAGKRAQVVIANPAGITCDGCGFINAPQLTLTTGVPVMKDGYLDRFLVSRGEIRIEGLGLDASRVDSAELIARAVKINAGLWANYLRVMAGRTESGVDAVPAERPAFALDVAAIGGMYAGKIFLVGTEAGLGVRNAGQIQAGEGGLVLTAEGRLENRGQLLSAGSQQLHLRDGLDNPGTVYAGHSLDLRTPGPVNNARGLIAAGQQLSLQDTHAERKTLAITNTGGRLLAGESLVLDADRLSGDGSVVSGGDLSVKLQQDYRHQGEMAAARSATVDIEGVLTNEATLTAGDALTVTASQIHNEATGEIVSGQVQLKATASHALINQGLINGDLTRIDTITFKNQGGGRLYGDHVVLNVRHLENRKANGQAPVIAARQRLDIATRTLDNIDGALIYSDGDIAIGGTLNETGQVTGRAERLTNHGATIEAARDLQIAAEQVENTNADFRTRMALVSTEQIEELQASGSPKRYRPGDKDVYVYNDQSDHLHTPEGNAERWSRYVYTRKISETLIEHSQPGKLLAGRDLKIAAETLNNDKSEIVAGGNLKAAATMLINQDGEGKRIIDDRGEVTSYWRRFKRGTDTTGWQSIDYAPPLQTMTIRMNALAYRSNAVQQGESQSTPALPVGNSKTVPAMPALPGNAIFQNTKTPEAHYLIETDPRFANYRQWLSSDYLLNAMAVDPGQAQKRLGDGFYEQKLVREQITQLTGRRLLAGQVSDESQYQALMANAVTFAKAHALVPGIALSAEQMAALTSDIVWLVEKDVTLPDGRTTRALVPQVYVKVREGDLQPSGALIAGGTTQLQLSGNLHNSGTIAGHESLKVLADNLSNRGGQIQGRAVHLHARTDLENRGGQIRADQQLVATAGRDILIASTTSSSTSAQGSRTQIDQVAGLTVTGERGDMTVIAGRDLSVAGATVTNRGEQGNTVLAAGHNLTLDTVTESDSLRLVWDKDNHRSESRRTETGSTVTTQGDLTLQAGNNLRAKGARVSTDEGALRVAAGKDLTLTTASAEEHVDEAHKHVSRGTFSKKTVTTRDTLDTKTHQGSTFSGQSVALTAGADLTVQGSQVVSTTGTTLTASGDVTLTAATDRRDETHYRHEKKSGVMSGGGLSVVAGTRQLSTLTDTERNTSVAAVVGSTNGDVQVHAGDHYRQTGSQLLAPGGDIAVQAADVSISEARITLSTTTETRFKQTGVTLSVTNPVIQAAQTVQQMAKAASKTNDKRIEALAVATAGLAAYTAYSAVSAGQGTTIDNKPNQIAKPGQSGPGAATRDANAIDKVGGLTIGASLGTAKSESKTVQTADTAAASQVLAGGKAMIVAAGKGSDSDLLVRGSDIRGREGVVLKAEGDLSIQAAANHQAQHSTNSSKSASAGVAFNTTTGFSVNAAFSSGRGHADGEDQAWRHSRVEGDQVRLQSGDYLQIRGATVDGKRVVADVGKDLRIESVQDTSTFDSKQKNLSASVSVGVVPMGMATSANQTAHSDYASVVEQSGIRAGEQGFQIAVKGNTHLAGSVIDSAPEAAANQRNSLVTGSFTATAIDNQAHASAKTSGVVIGNDLSNQGTYGAAKAVVSTLMSQGKESGHSVGTTQSAVQRADVTLTNADKAEQSWEALSTAGAPSNKTHVAAVRQDVHPMLEKVTAEQAIKQKAFTEITRHTDAAYKVLFQDQVKYYRVTCSANTEACVKDPKLVQMAEITKEMAEKETKILSTNGIFNDAVRAAELSYQNTSKKDDSREVAVATDMSSLEANKNPITLMHVKPAATDIGEILVAGYQKHLANFLGYANLENEFVDVMIEAAKENLILVGHSRGTVTQRNAFKIAEKRNFSTDSIEIFAYGSPLSKGDYKSAATKIIKSNPDEKIHFIYSTKDPISVIIGGNPGEFWESLLEFWQVKNSNTSTHSCYGSGAPGCQMPSIIDRQIFKPIGDQKESDKSIRSGK